MSQKRSAWVLALLTVFGLASIDALAQEKQPITIGFGMALTGGLAPNGKSALLAMQIWEEDVNAKGGLLGRPVKLVYYDDQSNPATVPALYTKLLDVDKVDLIVSRLRHQHDRAGDAGRHPAQPQFLGLFGLAVNTEFHYPKYFSMLPTGPEPKQSFSRAVLRGRDGAATRSRRRWPCVAADAEFPHNAVEGARDIAKKDGLKIVYDKTYPPGDYRLHADRARDPGDQSGHGVRRLLSAGFGRHDPRGDTRSG